MISVCLLHPSFATYICIVKSFNKLYKAQQRLKINSFDALLERTLAAMLEEVIIGGVVATIYPKPGN